MHLGSPSDGEAHESDNLVDRISRLNLRSGLRRPIFRHLVRALPDDFHTS